MHFQAGFSVVEVSVPQSDLREEVWHSLAVAVGPSNGVNTAVFYIDGAVVTSR